MNRFDGKVVLVTGACRATGYVIARAFAREGATVWVNGRSEASAGEACARLAGEVPAARLVAAPADIGSEASLQALFARIGGEAGRLDVLVNNAVDQAIGQPFLDASRTALESAFAVNVFGVFTCAQLAARIMRAQGGGAIVNLGSNVSTRAIRNRAAYIASKGAVDALTNALAVELGPLGIRVNTLAAGYIRTNRWETLDPAVADRRRLNIPLGRELTGDQVAEGVLFLASDASAGMTGARVVMDGGCSAQHMPPDADG